MLFCSIVSRRGCALLSIRAKYVCTEGDGERHQMVEWFRNTRLGRWYGARSWIGRRVLLVLLALFAGWLITAVVLFVLLDFDIANRHEVFIGALVAWTGELIFFSILGVIVTLVTLKDPSQASFEERLRILFGLENLPEAVTEYNKRMISRLAGYARLGQRRISLEEYRPEIKAYRARVKTEYQYRNLLSDIDYEAPLPWRFVPDKIDGASTPFELGRIISIKIGDEEHVRQPIIVDESGFATEFTLRMSAKGETTAVFEYITWMAVGELQTMFPRRFVEEFSMTIVNQCTENPAGIILEGRKDAIKLIYNNDYPFRPVQSVAPEEKIFVFSLLPPQ
jgi:hypothetical protein